MHQFVLIDQVNCGFLPCLYRVRAEKQTPFTNLNIPSVKIVSLAEIWRGEGGGGSA